MQLNAIDMLKKDHEKVKDLLDQLTQTTERAHKTRRDLLDKIEQELSMHTRLEEEIFYPAFKDADGKEHEKQYFEAIEEHRAVESMVLPDLKKTDPGSVQFAGRAKVLRELITHHISDEEEEMFPAAEKTLGAEQLQVLGKQMQECKKAR